MQRHGVLHGLGRVPRRYALLGWVVANVVIYLRPHLRRHQAELELDD